MSCPHFLPTSNSSDCSFSPAAGLCSRGDHLLCDQSLAVLIGNRPHVHLLVREEELPALALRMSKFGRAGIHVLPFGDGVDATARGLVIALDDGTLHLVDLLATRTLGPLDDLLPRLSLVGHDLKQQLIALAAWLKHEPLQLFDTQIAARLLDGGRNPGRQAHGLREVLRRHLDVELPHLVELPSTGLLSSLHRRNAAHQAAWLLRLADELIAALDRDNLTDVAQLEFSVLPPVVEMEIAGIAIDIAGWKNLTMSRQLRAQQLKQRLCAQLGLQDLRHPAQVRDALARMLGIPLTKTDAVSLAPVAHLPVVQDLVRHRKDSAFLQQLGWPLLEQLAHSRDGRVRCSFDSLGAVTGRFTATNPNLLGVPRDEHVRECFIAGAAKTFINADYSNIDLRVLAQVAPAKNLIDIFNAGGDVHRNTAGRMLGKSPANVSDGERYGAKPVNFGMAYGMGPNGLTKSALKNYNLSLTRDEAETWIDAFFTEYPGVKRWQGAVHQLRPGEVRTLAGRVRYFDGPDIKLTEQLATIVQGSTADGFKRAIARLYVPLKSLDARIVLAPHDELLVEASIGAAEEVKELVAGTMKDGMAELIQAVPIEVEAKHGPTWCG